MSPVGGPGARRLRGTGGEVVLDVDCTCGYHYVTLEDARDLAKCPECHRPTSEIPRKK